jgi:predicted transcriptional regulator
MRKTTTKAGGPNYANLYKNLQEDHIELQTKLSHLQDAFKGGLEDLDKTRRQLNHRADENSGLHKEITSICRRHCLEIDVLRAEADNMTLEIKENRNSSRAWFTTSIILFGIILAIAVIVGRS